jgi:ATP-dependent Clp protease ATP-binding subunit ClpA
MAPAQDFRSAAYRAWGEARRLDHGWIGPEHVLLALFDEPSATTEALEELGVTREQAEEDARAMGRSEPPGPAYDPPKGQSPNPAWYKLIGLAQGLALAAGRRWAGNEQSCSPWCTESC